MTENLPGRSKVADIRSLLIKSKAQMAMALPKHLTPDRLIRVAMTSIQKNPKLLDCTQQSLLACIMTCASLGLEPDQFLGQAYLVPFKDTKKGIVVCTLIPGYRGYIALARRSGEMQTVSAQVVYENDTFKLQYGINDVLEHIPCMDGDKGKPIGAYCVFKYKDGGYSFDFLTTGDIEKVRARSKASGLGKGDSQDVPWVTDWAEMAKKTVIKRHSKLAPLSVEFQRAVALEDRAMSGESQADLLGMEDDAIEADVKTEDEDKLKTFTDSIPQNTDETLLNEFLQRTAEANKSTVDEVKISASEKPKEFWKVFNAWVKQKKANEKAAKEEPKKEDPPEMAKGECPNSPGSTMTAKYCNTQCDERKGCPVWG